MDFVELLRDKHRWALAHKEKGFPVVGCYSALVPEELMWACGAFPVQLLTESGAYGSALSQMPSYVCDCSKSIVSQLLEGAYDYLDGMIVSHVCETIRGIAGIWSIRRPDKFVHVFTPPASNDIGARTYLQAEFRSLAEKLGRLGGNPLSMKKLQEAIKNYESDRTLIRKLYQIRAEKPWAIPPEQVLGAVLSAGFVPRHLHVVMLEKWMKKIPETYPGRGPAIILSGLVFENQVSPGNAFFAILRKYNAQVVWDDLAWGMRYNLRDENKYSNRDPMNVLVERFLGPHRTPIRGSAEIRSAKLIEVVHQYGGKGVIFLTPKYCDPLLFDLPAIIRKLNERKIPSLSVEISGASPQGQLKTRLEAFLEMLCGDSEG